MKTQLSTDAIQNGKRRVHLARHARIAGMAGYRESVLYWLSAAADWRRMAMSYRRLEAFGL